MAKSFNGNKTDVKWIKIRQKSEFLFALRIDVDGKNQSTKTKADVKMIIIRASQLCQVRIVVDFHFVKSN